MNIYATVSIEEGELGVHARVRVGVSCVFERTGSRLEERVKGGPSGGVEHDVWVMFASVSAHVSSVLFLCLI